MSLVITPTTMRDLQIDFVLSVRDGELRAEKSSLWVCLKSYVLSHLGITRFGDYRFPQAVRKFEEIINSEEGRLHCLPSLKVLNIYRDRLTRMSRGSWLASVRQRAYSIEEELGQSTRGRVTEDFFTDQKREFFVKEFFSSVNKLPREERAENIAQLCDCIHWTPVEDLERSEGLYQDGTVLHLAADLQDEESARQVISALYDKRVSSHIGDWRGYNPLERAIHTGNKVSAQVLRSIFSNEFPDVGKREQVSEEEVQGPPVSEESYDAVLKAEIEGLRVNEDKVCEEVQELDIPPLPDGVNIGADLEKLLADPAVDAREWPASFLIQDDEKRRTKEELFEKTRQMIAFLQQGGEVKDIFGTPLSSKAIRDARAMYGHVFRTLLQERDNVQAIRNPQERAKALKGYRDDLRRFLQGLGCSLYHCVDRLLADGYLAYSKYVLKEHRSLDDKDKEDLSKAVDKLVFVFRKRCFQQAVDKAVEGKVYQNEYGEMVAERGRDQASTERVATQTFNKQMGLRVPFTGEGGESYRHVVSEESLNEIASVFWDSLYTKDPLIDYVTERVEQEKLHMKIQEHFQLNYPTIPVNSLYDTDEDDYTKVTVKREVVALLLKDLKYLN